MNILAICPGVPAQDAKGYQVLAYYRLRHLSKNHRIDLVCFGHGKVDEARRSVLIDMGVNVHMLPWSRTTAIISLAAALFNRNMPLQCALFKSSRFRDAVQNLIRSTDSNVIHVTTIRVLPNIDKTNLPILIDLVDSMALNFRRRAEQAPWWSRPIFSFEQHRVSKYEVFASKRSVASFVVSKLDQQEIGLSRVHVIPLGIDTERYSRGLPATEPIIAFTGNMAYRPNIEAALWVARYCWPTISATNPRAMLVIAGSSPVKAVEDLAFDPTVRVTGRVPSMARVLRGAQIAVAPMQSGSGMQFKILEAMACGIPVITSTLGLGDIQATPNLEILVVDSPSDFIKATLFLLGSDDIRAKIGTAGLNYIHKNHAWDILNNKFEEIMRSCMQNRSDANRMRTQIEQGI